VGTDGDFAVASTGLRMRLRIKSAMTMAKGASHGIADQVRNDDGKGASHEIAGQARNDDDGGFAWDCGLSPQ
jgi:hypothetical protein